MRRRIIKTGITLTVLAVLIYLGVSAYGAYRITHIVRWPIHTTPEPYGMAYATVHFASVPDNIPLEGWFIDSPGTRTLLVLHGVSSARDNYINMEVGRVLYQHGYDLLMFDFRGHGGSGGEISTLGDLETRDIAGALAYLKGRGITQVGAIGWSMGAATLLNAAPEHPEIAAIVADSSFSDLMTIISGQREEMGAPALFDPGIVLMSRLLYGFDPSTNRPVRAIGQIGNRPVLLIHSESDPLIPVGEARELADAGGADPNLQLWLVPGAGHVSAFSFNEQEYTDKVIHFFDSALGGAGHDPVAHTHQK